MDTELQNSGFFNSVYEQLEGQRGIGAAESVNEFDPLPSGKRVFEVGFGQGRLARALIDRGNKYYGIDVGKASIEGAIKEGFIDQGTFLYMDVCTGRFPFIDNFFDYCYMTETIEHLENPYHVFAEVKRVLKGEGIFIISFPRPEDNFGYSGGEHAHMYPGFLLKYGFRHFLNQTYFRVLKYGENGSSAWYKLQNVKTGNEVGVHVMIQGNYDEKELYGGLRGSWNEELEPEYREKTLHRFRLKIRGKNE